MMDSWGLESGIVETSFVRLVFVLIFFVWFDCFFFYLLLIDCLYFFFFFFFSASIPPKGNQGYPIGMRKGSFCHFDCQWRSLYLW